VPLPDSVGRSAGAFVEPVIYSLYVE